MSATFVTVADTEVRFVSLYDELNSLDDLSRKLVKADVRESDILEYKRASVRLEQSDRNEAAKDISAFANASGGLLVYGVATDPNDKTKPAELEAIDPWNIEYVLGSRSVIRQPVPNIRWKVLSQGAKPEALLIDVPKSPIAPHQVVTLQKYFRREGVDNLPMAHDLIELYFGRRMQAMLEPRISNYTEPESPAPDKVQCRGELSLLNRGGQIGRDVFIRLSGIDNRVTTLIPEYVSVETKGPMTIGAPKGQVFAYQVWNEFFHPGVPKDVVRFSFVSDRHTVGSDTPVLFLDVYAADSRPYRYSFYRTFGENGWTLKWEEAGLPPFD